MLQLNQHRNFNVVAVNHAPDFRFEQDKHEIPSD